MLLKGKIALANPFMWLETNAIAGLHDSHILYNQKFL